MGLKNLDFDRVKNDLAPEFKTPTFIAERRPRLCPIVPLSLNRKGMELSFPQSCVIFTKMTETEQWVKIRSVY
jgi:hypothetical protein